MQRDAFMYLLLQEIKCNRKTNKKRWWTILYIIIGILCGLAFFTYTLRFGEFQLQYIWFFTFSIPYIMLGISLASISKEWKNRMYGWWLTLPYSRESLIYVKLLGSWIQSLEVVLFAFGTISLVSVYAGFVSDRFSFDLILEHLESGLPWLALLLGFFPLISSFSFLTFVSSHTKYRPMTPILWIVHIIFINSIYWMVLPSDNSNSAGIFSVEITNTSLLVLIISWVVAWMILKIVARWLEKEIIV